MAKPQGRHRIAACRCGLVAFEAVGEPIVGAACYCTSCRTAGENCLRCGHTSCSGMLPTMAGATATCVPVILEPSLAAQVAGEHAASHIREVDLADYDPDFVAQERERVLVEQKGLDRRRGSRRLQRHLGAARRCRV